MWTFCILHHRARISVQKFDFGAFEAKMHRKWAVERISRRWTPRMVELRPSPCKSYSNTSIWSHRCTQSIRSLHTIGSFWVLLSLVVFSLFYSVFLSKSGTPRFSINESRNRSELIKFDIFPSKIAIETHFHHPKPCQNKYRLNGSFTAGKNFFRIGTLNQENHPFSGQFQVKNAPKTLGNRLEPPQKT